MKDETLTWINLATIFICGINAANDYHESTFLFGIDITIALVMVLLVQFRYRKVKP